MLYIAGYLNRKTNERYTLCFSCYGLWKIESIDATKDNYIFVKRKQYEHLSSNQGLVFPSDLIVRIVSKLELAFRNRVSFLQSSNVFSKLVNAMELDVNLSELSCNQPNCIEAVKYLVSLFARVRLNHFLKEQNRSNQAPHQK